MQPLHEWRSVGLHSNRVLPKLQRMPDVNAPIIAALNDHTRQTFMECRVVITQGVQGLKDVPDLLDQVRRYDAFTPDNDPYGEHDFGAIQTIRAQRAFGRLITTISICTCIRQIQATRLSPHVCLPSCWQRSINQIVV